MNNVNKKAILALSFLCMSFALRAAARGVA
jgi:hypothetical protein